MNVGKGLFGWVLFIAMAVMLFMLLNKQNMQYATISIGDFSRQLEQGHVSYVDIGSDQLVGEFRGAQTVRDKNIEKFRVPLPTGSTADFGLVQWLIENGHGAGVGVDNDPGLLKNFIIPLVPWILIFFFIWFFVFRQLRKQTQTNEIKPWPVYIVSSMDPIKPGQAPAVVPVMPMPPLEPQKPNTPAPGGDN